MSHGWHIAGRAQSRLVADSRGRASIVALAAVTLLSGLVLAPAGAAEPDLVAIDVAARPGPTTRLDGAAAADHDAADDHRSTDHHVSTAGAPACAATAGAGAATGDHAGDDDADSDDVDRVSVDGTAPDVGTAGVPIGIQDHGGRRHLAPVG